MNEHVHEHEGSLPPAAGHDVATPVWALRHETSWADRTLARLPLLAGSAVATGAVANLASILWNAWHFSGPDGSITAGERVRIALGASTNPLIAALLVIATTVVLVPPGVVLGRATPPATRRTRAVLVVLCAVQVLYGLGALIATIDAFAVFDPARGGRFDIPFGQTGPTRVARVATLLVAAVGALVAAAGRTHLAAGTQRRA